MSLDHETERLILRSALDIHAHMHGERPACRRDPDGCARLKALQASIGAAVVAEFAEEIAA